MRKIEVGILRWTVHLVSESARVGVSLTCHRAGNNDGWPDLYCADDFGPDQLFLNARNGTFQTMVKR